MKGRWFLVAAALAGSVHAQTPGEISFWESVRDSKSAAELQAYIDRYPDGTFVPLAKARLAALQGQRPATPSPKPAALSPTPKIALDAASARPGALQAGDTWTYRATLIRRRGEMRIPRPVRNFVVRIESASSSEVVDQLTVDGGTPLSMRHQPGRYLALQGLSVFSPYFGSWTDLSGPAALGSTPALDPDCNTGYVCTATARIVGREAVTVPAGTFAAIRIVVDQSWRSSGSQTFAQGNLSGGRTLTAWYAPQVKRVVKYSSRVTVGEVPPIDPHFDLELVSYQLK